MGEEVHQAQITENNNCMAGSSLDAGGTLAMDGKHQSKTPSQPNSRFLQQSIAKLAIVSTQPLRLEHHTGAHSATLFRSTAALIGLS